MNLSMLLLWVDSVQYRADIGVKKTGKVLGARSLHPTGENRSRKEEQHRKGKKCDENGWS